MGAYRVVRFDEVFSKRDAMRNAGAARWVSVPIDFASSGYEDLVDEFGPDAPAIYGAWIVTVQVAARCDTPGTLTTSRGVPLTPERVARRAQMPTAPFVRLFEWAQTVGWLELVESGQLSGESAAVCPDELPQAVRTTGQDRTGQDRGKTRAGAREAPPSSASLQEEDPDGSTSGESGILAVWGRAFENARKRPYVRSTFDVADGSTLDAEVQHGRTTAATLAVAMRLALASEKPPDSLSVFCRSVGRWIAEAETRGQTPVDETEKRWRAEEAAHDAEVVPMPEAVRAAMFGAGGALNA